ncbi:hydantoinase [Methanosarcina sp. 2.H.T.1A.6]|uniref:hydantoinase/oxoprolinase family protein n=1 Tax=unclassified Methanosarcina TaxID=2644672 RepID=UPI000621C732|nr:MULTISPECIES: hydantoinase/oxoprolinase family protein [unclassified Methanosarcina]KKG13500.1 hydantoinase [Methanosarcina sp. 2.H.T.1A.3]KKG18881.1 hydantoinase [Methanosarcina sp. 2.H.T.1A.15]KKG24322.1 hydantoinase [Methanosarcina sp. 2.H.T.1A.6]KKG24995.1 hydantoinase [Methanosarcina sp. 2.H.T.1A.8]
MLIGIDVGGTTTDAVLIRNGEVYSTAKVSTERGNLLKSLLNALDEVSRGVPPEQLERVVFSTTVITNLIAEGKTDRVALLLIPGPGVNPSSYIFPDSFYLKGAMDFRGREIQPLDEAEVRETVNRIREQGYFRAAVVSKFGQRNPSHELRIEEILWEMYPDCQVGLGHKVSGKLNFPRRIATSMLASATGERYQEFVAEIKKALEERDIRAPVYILKADGGTLPIDKSVEFPVETIFSGPAASTIGALALTPEGQTSVVVDIGGTTTDIALILSGKPLIASKGAKLGNFLTHVRAFAVRSIAVGGDSIVRVRETDPGLRLVTIGPERAGPAYCMGGEEPTPTDALRVLGLVAVGDSERAKEAVASVASSLGKSVIETASLIVDTTAGMIEKAVREMFLEWEQEPAYRIWEVLQKKKERPENVVGIGGGARGLISVVAEKLNAKPITPEYSEVGNAIGAAVARPTLTLNLRIDTQQKVYSVAEEGEIVNLNSTDIGNFNKMRSEEAEALATKLLRERAKRFGISEYADEAEIANSEVFNVVEGWFTAGRLFDVSMQIPAGLIPEWKREEKA